MVARRGEGAGDCEGGPWAARYVSPLWTLQRLCFGPDVAADPSDRGENRDPGTAIEENNSQLTKETRLENARRSGAECAKLELLQLPAGRSGR